jgi:TonB-dependent receptor
MLQALRLHILALTVVLAVCALPALYGQTQRASINGHVSDTTHAVIQQAQVVVTPGNLAATSDALGDFVLAGLAPGGYTVTITSTGFKSLVKTITLTAGQTATLDAVLQIVSNNEEVVVSAEGGQDQIQAVNEELTSPNIVQVMPRTEIVDLPNANIADAVGRLPGVTLQRDEGEGEYIQVRGLDPRLTNLTIDGVTVPSPEAAVRQVDLAAIPADMIQSIELNKTLSANQDADGIGGSVNLLTKTAGEQPTFTFGSTLGQTPIENDRYMGSLDTTVGRRFGANKRLGLIMGGDYDYNGRGINDIEPSPDVNPDGTATPYYDSITLRDYRFQRLRWSTTAGADYKLNSHSTINLRGLYSNFKDWGDKWYYEVQTDDKPKFYESRRRPDFAIGNLTLSGNHVFNNYWITWGSAASRSRELNSGGNPKVTGNPLSALKKWASANCDYASPLNGNQYLPQWSSACMAPNTTTPADNIYSLANYTMNQFVTTTGQAVQLNLQEWIAAGKNYHLGSLSATLEFGGQFRNNHKFQNAYTPTWDAASGINMAQFQSGFTDPHYYGGSYQMGQLTSYPSIQAYFVQNPANFTLDINDTHFGSDAANFDLVERVSAGYIMNTINWNKLRLQTGLRIEGTTLRTLGYVPNQDANQNWISDTTVTGNQSYWDPLPSIQARYAFTADTNLRAVYARGISRPNPYDVVPYISINDGGNPATTVGNPNLLPTHANNFDLLFEHQLHSFGLVEAGYFYKQLSNPIFADYTVIPSTSPYYGISGNPIDIQQQNVNGTNAHVSGLELSWQQRFASLPSAFSGLGMNANYAYTASDTEGVPGRTDTPALVGTAKNTFNLEPSYEYHRYSGHMGLSYNGPNVYAYQYINSLPSDSGLNSPGPLNGPWGDNYFYSHMQIDAQAGIRLYGDLRLEVEGLNLNNEVFGFYNGSPQYMTQREFYKPTYSASLRWSSGRE